MTQKRKKEVAESHNSRDISGFGDSVVKLTDKETGEVIAFIGVQAGEERVHVPKPITPDQLEAVSELVQRKKFNKHISNERFDKAQEYANRKFS